MNFPNRLPCIGLVILSKSNFSPEETDYQVNKGHGRIEKRKVSICQAQGNYPDWPKLNTIIRVEYERQTLDEIENGIRYYITDFHVAN